jgi:hypothetical protein
MIKKLFFTTALLVPGLAYGGNPSADLSVQVVPAGKAGTCGTIIGQAATDSAAAGFNTCALYNDFTTAIPNTVGTGLPSNWLNCTSGIDTGAVWNANSSYNIPCSAQSQVVDPVYGNQALDLHLNRSWLAGQGQQYGNFAQITSAPWDTDTTNPNAHSWSNGYFEITYRQDADNFKFPGSQQAFWSWGQCCGTGNTFVEQDFFEDWNTGGAHMDIAWDWWGTGTFGNGTPYSSHDARTYHTFGALITGNYNNFAVCNYYDGTRIGCYNQSYQSGQDGTQRRKVWVQNGAQCPTQFGDISCVGASFNDSHMYIKSIRVVTCAAEPAGGSCLGNTNNGSFYQP